MRLIEVARRLGITGQELRHELSQVDFGIKPTDREIPDRIAQGVLRYVATKRGIIISEEETTPAPQQRNVESEEVEEKEDTDEPETKEEKPKQVHVLRKLTLEDVPEDAVRAHAAARAAALRQRKPKRSNRRAPTKEQKTKTHEVQEQIKKKEGIVELPESITVKEFAEKTGVQVPEVVSVLMKNGILASINQNIDFDTAAIVAEELKVQVKKVQEAATAESLLAGNLQALLNEPDTSTLSLRPPIVTVMGHVDHGKTAILDAIRKTDVVSGEAGGITQAIGAYQIEHDTKDGTEHAIKRVTFLDTPGHEAFTSMRARGAQITDIVILVIAADEGIKPTTIEAIDHAKEAKVPIIVALNKMDREGADVDRVKGELASHELQPEDWGGKIPVIPCSAKTGQGISELLDHIILIAEMEELKANFNRPAIGTVIESHLDSSLGPVASVVLNTGSLKKGDICVCGTTTGRIKSMTNARGIAFENAGPSDPVRIAGLSGVPETGDILQVVSSDAEAKKLLGEIQDARELGKKKGLGDLISRLSEGKMTMLKIVLKADSLGEIEAIQGAIGKVKSEEGAAPKVIHTGAGNISESDVMMAAASDGIVLGFNVTVSTHVESIARKHGVEVRTYDIIYELLDDVEALLSGLLEPVEEEKILGHLEIKGTFFRKKADQVVGGKVIDGVIKRVPVRIQRGEQEIGTGRITSIKHIERDVKEGTEGKEYGLRIDSSTEIQEGDIIEAYIRELQKKK